MAQLTGERAQNTASASSNPWLGRFGHAMAVLENRDAEPGQVLRENEKSRLFLFGGDTYNAQTGGGGFNNDVWSTTGINWIAINHQTKETHYSSPLPRLVSKTTWLTLSSNRLPPINLPYREWLCCVAGWQCLTTADCILNDPFLGQRRWSPRRNHAAVALNNDQIFIMGGRARVPFEDIPEDEAIGGIIGERIGLGGANSFWREKSILMNDVWSTPDGTAWTLVTPGCYTHQEDLTLGNGTKYQQCSTDADCVAQRLGQTLCQRGRCVCQMWSPREQFGAVEHNGALFIVGGLTHIRQQLCGRLSCGEGYRAWLNDVWTSTNGATWTALNLNGPASSSRWQPRGNAVILSAAGFLWVLGGITGTTTVALDNPMLNDIWRSSDGITWTLNGTAPWGPRAFMTGAYVNGEIVINGGQDIIPPPPPPTPLTAPEQVELASAMTPIQVTTGVSVTTTTTVLDGFTVMGAQFNVLDETWTWNLHESGATWVQDFSSGTIQERYVRPTSEIALLNFSDPVMAVLQNHSITTIAGLAGAQIEAVTSMKAVLPDICLYKNRAERLNFQCTVQYEPYDGEFIKDVVIIEGDAAAADSAPTVEIPDDGCDAETESLYPLVIEYDVDLVCGQAITARHGHASAVMDGLMYFTGGWHTQASFGADLWYRDPTLPRTHFSRTPKDGTADTVFEFFCEDTEQSFCLFEYRVLDLDKGPSTGPNVGDGRVIANRNWSLALPPVDYREWLFKGPFRFEVRAIDGAGNKDTTFIEGRNVWTWTYVPPLPWLIIILSCLAFIGLCVAFVVWYRRYKRKKAMERYALKRLRRKLKAAKQGDWRSYYDEKKRKKKRKKKKDRKKPKKGKKGKKDSRTKGRRKPKKRSKKKKKS